MTRFLYTLLVVTLFSASLQAQSSKWFTLVGSVSDSLDHPLISATVVILDAEDSTLVNFTATNESGNFALKRVKTGQYLLQISYLGYQTLYRPLNLNQNLPETMELGQFLLKPAVNNLGEVLVNEERIPVRIKKDTIEFDARSFKTQPNAPVEDLLKRLPGMQVEKDGTVKAQGETVDRVLVDGKEFFGKDPKMATKNLPADAVDKVQVFDKKSDQAEFTGINDGQEEKTINLELKEDKKNGYFGNLMAGGGNDERFQAKANLNRFSKNQQLSFIGMGNNINEQGFSLSDYMNFMGGMSNMMSGGRISLSVDGDNSPLPLDFGQNDGFATTWAGGLNFNQEWKEKTELNGSYFFNHLDRTNERTTSRQTFLTGEDYFSDSYSLQNNTSDNHRLNLRFDHEFDSLQSIRITTSVGQTNKRSELKDESSTITANENPVNSSQREYEEKGDNRNMETDLLYRRKFKKKGRTFSSGLSFGLNETSQEGLLNAINAFNLGSGLIPDTIQQNNVQENDNYNYGLRFSYTEPVSRRSYIELKYRLSGTQSKLLQKVYDLPLDDENNPILNDALSNNYKTQYTYHTGGLNFQINTKYSNITLGVHAQNSMLDGEIPSAEVTIDQSFLNILPMARWNYEVSSSSNLELEYRTNVREPSVRELQPLIDNSDPLNIYQGNPNLRPEYAHNIATGFHSFDAFSFTSFFTNIDLGYAKNKIAYAQTINDQFVRSYQPVNTDYQYEASTYVSFGTPIRKIGAMVTLNSNARYSQGLNFINEEENTTDQLELSGGFRLENRKKEKIDAAIGARLTLNQTTYELNSQFDQEFLTHEYFTDFVWNLPLDFTFDASLTYTIYNGLGSGFDQDIPIINSSISKYLLKDKRIELKLAVRDLLNQNVGINRVAQLNYVEDVKVNSLGRFFMLSIVYSIKGFGKKAPGFHFKQQRF